MVFTWLNLAILLCFVTSMLIAGPSLIVPLLLAPKAKGGDMGLPYECGMRPLGSSWTRFGINYYFYALLFLAFDVDVLYLFPVAAYYPSAEGWLALVKVFIFLFALGLGCLYFWKKGVFEWPRRIS